MKNLCITLLVVLSSFQLATAKSKKIDYYGRRHYNIALGVTNPLNAIVNKYGAQLENRYGNLSYSVGYTKYIGAYPGTQYTFEWQFYLRTRKRDQFYMYVRGIAGDAGLDTRKLSTWGDNSNILIGNFDKDLKFKSGNEYVGGGFGFGKRYNFNVLFVRWNFGFRACALVGDLPDYEKNMYRLMFLTGPTSIVEFTVNAGLQL